jgi:hypothetical protein
MSTIINIEPSGKICRADQKMTLIKTYPNNTKFVNLTPHVLNVHTNEQGEIELYATEYGDITELPEPSPNTVYITSGLVNAAINRSDVVSPGDHVRDESGRPIGCIGLRS